MIIFEEPKYLFVVGVILAIILFVIQLLLCFKARKAGVKRIPLYFALVCCVLCAMLFMGILGKGSSGSALGNVHQIVALILAIVAGISFIGIVAAWIIYLDRKLLFYI
jgi:quinol-cytochrome oxidoreductase complex cytochrome b subunit